MSHFLTTPSLTKPTDILLFTSINLGFQIHLTSVYASKPNVSVALCYHQVLLPPYGFLLFSLLVIFFLEECPISLIPGKVQVLSYQGIVGSQPFLFSILEKTKRFLLFGVHHSSSVSTAFCRGNTSLELFAKKRHKSNSGCISGNFGYSFESFNFQGQIWWKENHSSKIASALKYCHLQSLCNVPIVFCFVFLKISDCCYVVHGPRKVHVGSETCIISVFFARLQAFTLEGCGIFLHHSLKNTHTHAHTHYLATATHCLLIILAVVKQWLLIFTVVFTHFLAEITRVCAEDWQEAFHLLPL